MSYKQAAQAARRIVKRETLHFAALNRNLGNAALARFMRIRYRIRVRELRFSMIAAINAA